MVKNSHMGRVPYSLDEIYGMTMVVEGGCWEWMGGYGGPRHKRRPVIQQKYGSRWAYEHWIGPVPDGAHILHSCDNNRCVCPEHLRADSNHANIIDMMTRGRHATAEFTTDEVRSLRSREWRRGEMATYARERGVSQTTLSDMLRGRTYGWVG
jgi:hypothetical protein